MSPEKENPDVALAIEYGRRTCPHDMAIQSRGGGFCLTCETTISRDEYLASRGRKLAARALTTSLANASE